MLRPLERSHDGLVAFAVGEPLTDEEVEQGTSRLRDAIAQHGRIRVLYRLHDMSLGSFLTALGERLGFVREHADDVDRVAVVSGDTAAELLSKASGALGPVETRHFTPDEEEQAWAWLE